jgi:hypothetical protein
MMKPIMLSSRGRDWFFAFVLFAVVFVVYQPAWNGQLIWDDNAHITKPELRTSIAVYLIAWCPMS